MVLAAFALLAAVPVAQLLRLQADAGAVAEDALEGRLARVDVPAQRGTILDRNGTELAISVPRATVGVDRRALRRQGVVDPLELEAFASRLAGLLGVPPVPVADAVLGAEADDPWVQVAVGVEPAAAERAVRRLAERDGLGHVLVVDETSERLHPAGESGLRVVGNLGADGPGPLAGVERAFDEELAGTDGRMVVERSRDGGTISGGRQVLTPAVEGSDVQLTLDRTLQYEVERILARGADNAAADAGIAIVGRPGTGELLAVAGVERDEGTGEMGLADKPLAFSDAYQAGSVFKLVTVAAGYETGVIDDGSSFVVADRIEVADRTFSDHDAHAPRRMTVDQIVADSSNVGTITIAREVGAERLHDELVGFGFGRRTGVEHPAEAAGLLPDVADWSTPDLAAASIGTFQTTTPVQMWSAYNVIANDGRYVPPRLVAATVTPDGERRAVPPRPVRQVTTPETAARLERALRAVVQTGTGRQWDVPGFPVAAKTGTSRMPSPERVDREDSYVWPDGRYHYMTTFTGYLPADRPQVSITVMLIDTAPGLTGGSSAGPVFADLARLGIRELAIAPSGSTTPATAGTAATAAGPTGGAPTAGSPAIPAAATGPVRAAPARAGTGATDRPLAGRAGAGAAPTGGSTRSGGPSTTMAPGAAPARAAAGTTTAGNTTAGTGTTGAGPGHDDG